MPADHFGVLFYCCLDPDPAAARALAEPFVPRGRIDDAALARCTAFGPPALVRERLEEYVAGGASKFIVRPMCPPERMLDQLGQLATDVIPDFHRRLTGIPGARCQNSICAPSSTTRSGGMRKYSVAERALRDMSANSFFRHLHIRGPVGMSRSRPR